MITTEGDITSLKRGLILHQVNCQGAMNSGVARAIRDKYDVVYDEYRKLWGPLQFRPEELLGQAQFVELSEELVIGNLFGQLKDDEKHSGWMS